MPVFPLSTSETRYSYFPAFVNACSGNANTNCPFSSLLTWVCCGIGIPFNALSSFWPFKESFSITNSNSFACNALPSNTFVPITEVVVGVGVYWLTKVIDDSLFCNSQSNCITPLLSVIWAITV